MERAKPRLAESLRGLIDSGLHTVQTRLELLAVEVQEEKLRLTGLVINAVLCGLLLGFGIVFLMIFLTVLYWDDNRLLALGIGTATCLLGGAFAGLRVSAAVRRGNQLFSSSLAELRLDRAAFGRGSDPASAKDADTDGGTALRSGAR